MTTNNELYHYGVAGMKWGQRKSQISTTGLTDRQIKKYAKKGYAQDSYKSNKTAFGRMYDKITGAHKYSADMLYGMSSKKANRQRAERYINDQAAKEARRNTPAAKQARRKKNIAIGAAAAGVALAGIGAVLSSKTVQNKVLAKATISKFLQDY